MTEIIQEVEKERRFDIDNLAPIEHKFIGSTVSLRGQILNFEKEMERIINASSYQKKIKILRRILTPVNLQKNKNDYSIEKVANERLNKSHLKGSLTVFSLPDFERFYKQGRYLGLELSDLADNGMVVPEWRVLLVDRNGNIQPFGKEENLSLREKFKPYFDLFYDEQRHGLYLRLKGS